MAFLIKSVLHAIVLSWSVQSERVGAERMKHLSLENVANKVNATRSASELEPATLWAVFSTAADVYKGFKTTHKAYKSYVERSERIQQIASGHTQNTAELVTIAHAAIGGDRAGEQLKAAIEGDTFQQFKAMLKTFEQAEKMCIADEHFFKNPIAHGMRKFEALSEEKWSKLHRAQRVIGDIVKSMQGVVDYSMCPQLARAVKLDLEMAQTYVEKWERTVRAGGADWSWYEMLYNEYVHGGSEASAHVASAVMDPVRWGTTRKVDYPTREQCYSGKKKQSKPFSFSDMFGTQATSDADFGRHTGYDEYDADLSTQEAADVRDFGARINRAMDRASVNLEMYDKECKRVHEDGKWGLIKEIELAAQAGDVSAKRQWRAQACDLCMRYGCRSDGVLGILKTAHGAYKMIRYGIDHTVVAAAKYYMPQWFSNIVEQIHHLENVLDPSGDQAIEFFVSTVYLLQQGSENFRPRATCIRMGDQLENAEDSAEDTLRHLTGAPEDSFRISSPSHMGLLKDSRQPHAPAGDY